MHRFFLALSSIILVTLPAIVHAQDFGANQCAYNSIQCCCINSSSDRIACSSVTDYNPEQCKNDCSLNSSFFGYDAWKIQCEINGVIQSVTQEYNEQTDVTINEVTAIVPNLGLDYPGLSREEIKNSILIGDYTVESNILGLYINSLYTWIISAGAIAAIVLIMIGGFQWSLARGNSGMVEKAKDRIVKAVFGLVLLLGAYSIAFLINPDIVAFETLNIQYIEPDPFQYRSGFLDDANQTLEEQYRNKSCPSSVELKNGVTFYNTAYYKPAYNEQAGNFDSFECNVAMQCSCPLGTTGAKTCSNDAGEWAPCKEFPEEMSYCHETTGYKKGLVSNEPIGYQTVAADTACLPIGTVFKIFGSKDEATNAATWVVEDTGGWIHGRRVDLFLGTGSIAYNKAINNYGEITIRTCPNNDPAKCPTSLD